MAGFTLGSMYYFDKKFVGCDNVGVLDILQLETCSYHMQKRSLDMIKDTEKV